MSRRLHLRGSRTRSWRGTGLPTGENLCDQTTEDLGTRTTGASGEEDETLSSPSPGTVTTTGPWSRRICTSGETVQLRHTVCPERPAQTLSTSRSGSGVLPDVDDNRDFSTSQGLPSVSFWLCLGRHVPLPQVLVRLRKELSSTLRKNHYDLVKRSFVKNSGKVTRTKHPLWTEPDM